MAISVTNTIAEWTKIVLNNTIFSPAPWVCRLIRDQFAQWKIVEWELVDGCLVILDNLDNSNHDVETLYSDRWYDLMLPNGRSTSTSAMYLQAQSYAYWIVKFVSSVTHTLPPQYDKKIMIFPIAWFSYYTNQ